MTNKEIKNQKSIRKFTASAHIAALIFCLSCAYIGYKESIWLMTLVCSFGEIALIIKSYKYFFNEEYRLKLNQYHDRQRELPKEKRDGYRFDIFLKRCSIAGIVGFAIIALIALILNFFNLL